MNYRQVIKCLGIIALLVAFFMATSFVWAWFDRARGATAMVTRGLIVGVLVAAALGVGMLAFTWKNKAPIYRKEAILLAVLGWIMCTLLGAIPLAVSQNWGTSSDGAFHTWATAIFDSAAGFTTTGSTALEQVEHTPRALIYWRCVMSWLGGMGILTIFVALLGQTGLPGRFLFSSEVVSSLSESIHPRVRQTAWLMLKIYIGFSAVESFMLYWEGMPFFDCLCHTLSTVSTGGFSLESENMGHYGLRVVEITVLVFMLLAGISYNLHAAVFTGRWRAILRNRELQSYFIIIAGATVLIALDLFFNRRGAYTVAAAIKQACFHAGSMMSTTGFWLEDFNAWPSLSRWLLVLLMFIGGSAGSIAGGLKVIRISLFVRVALQEIERTFRPHIVRPLTINGRAVHEEVRHSVCFYISLVLGIYFAATLLLMVMHNELGAPNTQELHAETAFSAVATCLNNVGPGLQAIAPGSNFASFASPAKLLLAFLMILGRLEFMAVFCLFSPGFWRRW